MFTVIVFSTDLLTLTVELKEHEKNNSIESSAQVLKSLSDIYDECKDRGKNRKCYMHDVNYNVEKNLRCRKII